MPLREAGEKKLPATTTTGGLAALSVASRDSELCAAIEQTEPDELSASEMAKRMANASIYLDYVLSHGEAADAQPLAEHFVHVPIRLEAAATGDADTLCSNKQLITEEQFHQAFILNVRVTLFIYM